MVAKSSDKIVRRKKKIPRKKVKKRTGYQWIFFLFLLIFCVTIFYIFICSRLVDITKIEVYGNNRVDQDMIIKKAEHVLTGTKIACIKNRNFFLANKRAITESISDEPQIRTVHITKKFPHTMKIVVEEYGIVPIWCFGSENGSCYEIASSGCVQRRIDLNSPLVIENKHFIVVDRGHESLSDTNQCVVSREELEKMRVLGEELIYAMNIEITQPYIIDLRGSDEVRYQTDEGWYVHVDLGLSVEEILQMAQLFTRKVEFSRPRSDLEYVDLRFPEKIFYKLKGSVEESAEQDLENDENEEELHDK